MLSKRASRIAPSLIAMLGLLPVIVAGCTRSKYRASADREAYHTISERNGDPRWQARDVSINVDPRSRYFDRYDPDRPPMPRDDAASHRYMRRVNGMKGWRHWYDNGVRGQLENPDWEVQLAGYAHVNEAGAAKLDVDSALKLAYVHSPNHQSQLETLYLASLDVTTERFRLDTQFFGGYDLTYLHQGSLIPPFISFDPVTNRYVVTPATDGVESNVLSVGRPGLSEPALQVRRRFATAGELLAGFANSFVFEFTGADANLASSLANFSFIQPLLRGAGRDIALEQLTFAERNLLANLRAYSQFRQGFYTQVAIGEQGVSGPQRQGFSTNIQVFSGQGSLGGYVGLLQQLQQIRNSEDNLALQERTLLQLEAYLDAGIIDLVQVDQFRQNVERERSSLLQSRNSFLQALDTYKTSTLGLPPDLEVDLDDTLIRQFQLVDRDATGVQDLIAEFQARVGDLPDEAEIEVIRSIQEEIIQVVPDLHARLQAAEEDLELLDQSIPIRQRLMTDPDDLESFLKDINQLKKGFTDLQQQLGRLPETVDQIPEWAIEKAKQAEREKSEQSKLPEQGQVERLPPVPDDPLLDDSVLEATIKEEPPTQSEIAIGEAVVLLKDMLRIIQGTILVQARARLEKVSVDEFRLESADAFQIALNNRLDFMNGRAALVDDWRTIQVTADSLQSVLDFTATGDIRTARNNPVSFRAPTSNVRVGLKFDAPFTRLIERNAYRESLINYQRSRRNFIQSRDSLHLGLRVLLRNIEQLRTNLEIQRRAVAIAIRRVDLTRAALEAPVAPPQPGQPVAGFGPTAAINLLSAQSALRDTQNAFLGAYLNYYAAKMRLARELGVMVLDLDGRWIEMPPPGAQDAMEEKGFEEIPPPIEPGLIETVESLPEDILVEAPKPAVGDDDPIEDAGLID